MVHLVSLPPSTRPARRPAPQAPRPHPRIHHIDVGLGKRHAAPAPHAGAPLKAEGRQRHPARIGIPAMGHGKGQDVVSHSELR
jgi:hypothetical protein